MPPRKILWANRYCLLDTASGASITARQHLLQLARRGWEVLILGATVFDHERGRTVLKDHLPAKPGTDYLNVQDADGLQHRLAVTEHWHCDSTTNKELNKLYSLYVSALDQFKPDIVYYYGGNAFDLLLAEEARSRGVRTVALLVNPNYVGGTRWCRDVDLIITDSEATATFYQQKVGLEVVPTGTFIDPVKVVAPTHSRRHLLFINPVPEKGAFLVAQLATLMASRRPDIIFEVVESRGAWQPVAHRVTQALEGQARDLPNVVITSNQSDMRGVFARARLLLAPSLCWESGARVIAESLLNGIPVVVTDHGGSPEMMAGGGLLLKLGPSFHEKPYAKLPPAEVMSILVDRLIALYDNEEDYASYVQRARAAAAAKHDMPKNTNILVKLFEGLASSRSSNPETIESSRT